MHAALLSSDKPKKFLARYLSFKSFQSMQFSGGFLSRFLKIELLGHMVILVFNFLRNFKTVIQSGYYLNIYGHATFQIKKKKIKIYFKNKKIIHKIKGLSLFL